MKKLVIAAALAAGLSFPLASQAEVNAFGVSLPLQQGEVSDDVRGGYVAKDLNDTFQVQKLNSEAETESAGIEYENVYTVFGVRVSGKNVI